MTTMKRVNSLCNQYSPEFKANIVREILREEKSVAQIAAEHGIHPHQLYQWRDQALQGLPTLFSGQSAKEQVEREQAHERPHQALAYQTPAAVYRQLLTTQGGNLTSENAFHWS